MMDTAERHGEFIAGLATERARLKVAQVMRVGWLATADEAWLYADITKVLSIAIAPRCGNGEDALVDAVGSAKVSARGRARLARICTGNGQSLIARSVCPGWSKLGQPAFKGVLDQLGIGRCKLVLDVPLGPKPRLTLLGQCCRFPRGAYRAKRPIAQH